MEIDYNNLQNHFDIIATTDGSLKYSLVDKNREVGNKNGSATIMNLQHKKDENISAHFCDWWRHTENRTTVKNWFINKYGK